MFKWLTLQEYSNKYKVSISTLRRRIKTKEIKYNFEDGRYFLEDSENNLGIKDKDLNSFKDMQVLYKKVLEKKDEEFLKLKNELEDIKQLVRLLEKENKDLEETLKKSSALNPQPLL